MTTKTTDKVTLAEIKKDIEYIKYDVTEIKDKMEKDYVTQEEFKPIKRFVDIIQGLIVTGVIGAILALVIKQ